MREQGFYWVMHTAETDPEIGFFSQKTSRWTFCGIGRSIKDDELFFIGGMAKPNDPNENPSYTESTAVGEDVNVDLTQIEEVIFDDEPTDAAKMKEEYGEDVYAAITISNEDNKLFGAQLRKRKGRFQIKRDVFNNLTYAQLRFIFGHVVVEHMYYNQSTRSHIVTAYYKEFEEINDPNNPPEYKIMCDFGSKILIVDKK